MLYLFIGAALIIAGKSQTCSSDSDCSDPLPSCVGGTGNSDGICSIAVSGCSSDSDCSDPLPSCVGGTGNSDGVCSIAVSGCSSDSDCTTEGLEACFTTTSTCVACNDDDDCTGSSYYTNLGLSSCVSYICTAGTVSGCSSDSDCSDPLPSCIGGTGNSDGVCSVAVSGCSSDSDCTVEGFGACYTSTSTCVACNSDDDCTGSSFYTNLGYTSCVGVSCTAGTVTGGCSTDDDCTSDLLPVCYGGTGNSDGVCSVAATACSSADDCESGESCISSVCIAIDGACSSDTDCEDDEACLIGFCQATDCTTDDDCSGEGESCTTVSSVKLCAVGCTSDNDCDDSGEICGTIDGLSGGACFEEGTDGVTTYSDDVQQLSAIIGMIIMAAAGLFM